MNILVAFWLVYASIKNYTDTVDGFLPTSQAESGMMVVDIIQIVNGYVLRLDRKSVV